MKLNEIEMSDFSLLNPGTPLDCLDGSVNLLLKLEPESDLLLGLPEVDSLPYEDDNYEEGLLGEDSCILQTDDGQLLYVTYSDPAVDSHEKEVIFYLHNGSLLMVPPEDGNLLNVSSLENIPPLEQSADDILKVEDRVKVFDAVLSPAEKKSRAKPLIEPEEPGNYECDLCGATFTRAVQYYGHLHLHSGEFQWECQECPEGVTFSTQSLLRRHEKKHHINSRPYTCAQCGATFDRPSQLDYHKRRVHDGERSHVCQLCGKAFFKHSDLRTHLNIHLSVHGCICEICGRRFSHISNLSRHRRTHSGVKPYPCSICGRRFNQINSLNEHKESHDSEHRRVYTCCGKKFKTQILFKKHVKLLHSSDEDLILTQQVGNRRRFHCKVCGNSFPFLTLLRSHEKHHDKFFCLSCKKDLESLEALKSHSCTIEKPSEEDILTEVEERAINEYLESQNAMWLQGQDVQPSDLADVSSCGLGVDSLSYDGLDVTESLSCSEVDKLVRETCCQVGADDSQGVDSLEIDSLIVSDLSLPNDALIPQCILESFDPSNIDPSVMLTDSDTTNDLSNVDTDLVVSDPTVGLLSSKLTVDLSAADLTAELDNAEPDVRLQPDDDDEDPVAIGDDITLSSFPSTDLNTPIVCKEEDELLQPATLPLMEKVNVNINTGFKREPGSKYFICVECGKHFQKASNFKQHQGVHDIQRQLYRCHECGRTFAWKSTLKKHSMAHTDNIPTFACVFCNKCYLSASLLQSHINRDHLKQRPHACQICSKRFFKKYDLKIHLRTHTQERPYMCGTCGRGFGHISHLIRHERIHSGFRPYQCSKCPSSFIQSSSLISHQKHHSDLKADM